MERLQNHSKLLLSILGHRRKKRKTSVLIRLQILTLIRHLSLLWFFPLRWVIPHPATGRVPEFGAHPSRVSTCAIKCLGNRQKLAATGIFTGECLKGAYIIKWYTAFLYSVDASRITMFPIAFSTAKSMVTWWKKIGAVLWVTGSTSSRFSTTMAGMVGIPQLHTTLRPISSPGRQRNMDFKDLGRQHSCKWVVTRKLYVITINTNNNDKSTLVMYCNVMWCHVQVMRMSECLSLSLSLPRPLKHWGSRQDPWV